MELADAALRQEGSSAYRWMVRGELLVAGRDDVDRHCFDKAVQADRDWLVPLEIALIYLHHEQPSKALLRARQAVEKAPESFYAWFIQGQCEQALGFDRQAEQQLRALPGAVAAPRRGEPQARRARPTRAGRCREGLRRLIGR